MDPDRWLHKKPVDLGLHFLTQRTYQGSAEQGLNKHMLLYEKVTVNLEIFMRILFSRMALKDIFATLKFATMT